MKTFRDHTDDRKDHMTWKKDDIEILPDEDDRSSHMAWKKGDVEVLPGKSIKDSLREDSSSYEPHNIETAHLRKTELVGSPLSDEDHRYFADHSDKLNSPERTEISRYKDDSSDVNVPLRKSNRSQGGLTLGLHVGPGPWGAARHEKMIRKIGRLEKATNFPAPSDLTVFKGVQPNAGFHKLKPGQRFVDHGFTGTSFLPDIGRSFGGRYDVAHDIKPGEYPDQLHEHKIVARIHVPRGTLGHFLDVNGGVHSHEQEYLLHRGTQYRVLGHSTTDGDVNDYYNKPAHVIDLAVERQHPKKIINPHEGASFPKMMPRHHEVLMNNGFKEVNPGYYIHPEHMKGSVSLAAPYRNISGGWTHTTPESTRMGRTHISLDKSLKS